MIPQIGDRVVDMDTGIAGRLIAICPDGDGRVEIEHGVLFVPFHRLKLAEHTRIRRALRTVGEGLALLGVFAIGYGIALFGHAWGM